VAFLSRDAAKAEILGGERICPGAPTIVPTWLMHRHTPYWENPHQFDPDRFADEATKEAQRCAYLPFSMGPRVCVGAAFALQEAVLALSALVRRFRFHPVPGHVPEPVSRLTVRSDNGIPLLVERR
jgi:cytochrome P450